MYNDNDVYYVDRKFDTIFRDAIYFAKAAYKAAQNDDLEIEGPLARAAILNLSILPEVVANCLIEHLDLPSKLYNEIDRFSPINKMEFYLWETKKRQIDRGCQEVQNIMELQSIRNFMVHPKSKKKKWVQLNENTKMADLGATKLLKIPYALEEWQGDDPIVVMRVVMAFLDHYLRELCSFSSQMILYLPDKSISVDLL